MNTLFVALTVCILGAPIAPDEVKRQNTVFQDLWETEFVWKFDDLPEKGGVDEWRVPYSGYIYPDRQGGTASVTRTYDRAFNRGRSLATSYELSDSSQKEQTPGLFGGRLFSRNRTPDWYGHCNGWAAASIRHAEPVNSVTRNGVTFSPSDIKGLLAEIYIYNRHDVLAGGNEQRVNPASFHAIITNWLGRGNHPLGMESDPSEEKWNYPVYAYATSNAKLDPRNVEVKMNIAYAKDSNGEWDESPRIKNVKYFHYRLTLNSAGEITGGYFYRDSSVIDMLWVPRSPVQAGKPGNEAGNPYIDVDQVLALWRASVPDETRKKWLVVDPAPADRIVGEPEIVVSTEKPVLETGPVDGAETAESSDDTPATDEPAKAESTAKPEATDTTVADAPAADAPAADAAEADAPEADAPEADAPEADAPEADLPEADLPEAEAAGSDSDDATPAADDSINTEDAAPATDESTDPEETIELD